MIRFPTLALLVLLLLGLAGIAQGGLFDRALYRKDDRPNPPCKCYWDLFLPQGLTS